MQYNNQAYVQMSIKIKENKWGFQEGDLFELVIRNNPKRKFLFASTVLGKYIAVSPQVPQLIGAMLGMELYHQMVPGAVYENIESQEAVVAALKGHHAISVWEKMKDYDYKVDKNTLFIGFAETATGLGQSVFDCFVGECSYIHTTRMPIVEEVPNLCFKEEHSHAVDHACFMRNLGEPSKVERIVLIDDEITTGKTACNLIKALASQLHLKEVIIASILDWRTPDDQRAYQELADELEIEMKYVALLRGEIEVTAVSDMKALKGVQHLVEWEDSYSQREWVDKPVRYEVAKRIGDNNEWDEIHLPFDEKTYLTTKTIDGTYRNVEFMERATGRFGIEAKEHKQLVKKAEDLGSLLKEYRQYKRCLCVGTEEFIYWPSRIATYMGEGISFECSARSPIITIEETEYALKHAICFNNPDDTGLMSYLYNIPSGTYEELFWFLERDVCDDFKGKMTQALKGYGIERIIFVVL